jgi:hypothetical protein
MLINEGLFIDERDGEHKLIILGAFILKAPFCKAQPFISDFYEVKKYQKERRIRVFWKFSDFFLI